MSAAETTSCPPERLTASEHSPTATAVLAIEFTCGMGMPRGKVVAR
jgi:hypothetical protein